MCSAVSDSRPSALPPSTPRATRARPTNNRPSHAPRTGHVTMPSSDRGSQPTVPASVRGPDRADAWQTYRRLIGYLRPHRGMFLLGVLGAVVFSASMVSFTAFAKVFGDGTFENRDPRTIVWLPLALIG